MQRRSRSNFLMIIRTQTEQSITNCPWPHSISSGVVFLEANGKAISTRGFWNAVQVFTCLCSWTVNVYCNTAPCFAPLCSHPGRLCQETHPHLTEHYTPLFPVISMSWTPKRVSPQHPALRIVYMYVWDKLQSCKASQSAWNLLEQWFKVRMLRQSYCISPEFFLFQKIPRSHLKLSRSASGTWPPTSRSW